MKNTIRKKTATLLSGFFVYVSGFIRLNKHICLSWLGVTFFHSLSRGFFPLLCSIFLLLVSLVLAYNFFGGKCHELWFPNGNIWNYSTSSFVVRVLNGQVWGHKNKAVFSCHIQGLNVTLFFGETHHRHPCKFNKNTSGSEIKVISRQVFF